MKPVRVAVLAFEGVSLFHLSVPGIVFGVEPRPSGLPPYDVRYCTPTPGRVRSDQGIEIEVPDGLELMTRADIVVVPAWSHPEHSVYRILGWTPKGNASKYRETFSQIAHSFRLTAK